MHAPDPTAPEAPCRVGVVVEAPQHSGLWGALDYLHPQALPAGALVRVPLGRRVVTGVVWDQAGSAQDASVQLAPESLKAVLETFDVLPPLPEAWRKLVAFAAAYYQRSLGEMALMVLPPELRQLDQVQLQRRLKRLDKAVAAELAEALKASPQPASEGDAPVAAQGSEPGARLGNTVSDTTSTTTSAALPDAFYTVSNENTVQHGQTMRLSNPSIAGPLNFAYDGGRLSYNNICREDLTLWAQQTGASSAGINVFGVKSHTGTKLFAIRNDGYIASDGRITASGVTGLTAVLPICRMSDGEVVGYAPLYGSYS